MSSMDTRASSKLKMGFKAVDATGYHQKDPLLSMGNPTTLYGVYSFCTVIQNPFALLLM